MPPGRSQKGSAAQQCARSAPPRTRRHAAMLTCQAWQPEKWVGRAASPVARHWREGPKRDCRDAAGRTRHSRKRPSPKTGGGFGLYLSVLGEMHHRAEGREQRVDLGLVVVALLHDLRVRRDLATDVTDVTEFTDVTDVTARAGADERLAQGGGGVRVARGCGQGWGGRGGVEGEGTSGLEGRVPGLLGGTIAYNTT